MRIPHLFLVMSVACFGMVTQSGEAQGKKSPGKIVQNASDRLPDLKPEQIKDPYYRRVIAELQGMHPKRILLNDSPTETYRRLSFDNQGGRATKEDIPVAGQSFDRAWEIKTEKKAQEGMTQLRRYERLLLKRGDVLYLTAFVRAEELPEDMKTGIGRILLSIERAGTPVKITSLSHAPFVITSDWGRMHCMVTLPRDLDGKDELKVGFAFGGAAQTVQIGGIALIQVASNAKWTGMKHVPDSLPTRKR